MFKWKFILVGILISISLIGCSNETAVEADADEGIVHYEAWMEPDMESGGYSKINSVTHARENDNEIYIEIKHIEDVYGAGNRYLYTTISQKYSKRDKQLMENDIGTRSTTVNEPLTKFFDGQMVSKVIGVNSLTVEEEKELESHILNVISTHLD